MLKLVDSRGDQKTFEAEHALCDQRFDLVCIAGDEATPKTDVHPGLSPGGFEFGAQPMDRRCRRNTVQRHIEQRRHTARSSRSSSGSESFPIRSPGLIQMDVRIDEARHDDGIAGVEEFGPCGDRFERINGGDDPIPDVDRCRSKRIRPDHMFAANDESHTRMPPSTVPAGKSLWRPVRLF